VFDVAGAEPAATAALSVELAQTRDQLRLIAARIAEAATSAPRREASGWNGLAADAYQRALDQLARELEATQQLVRSATDLMGAAVFELGGHV
jgi:uncharacterized protein YukE